MTPATSSGFADAPQRGLGDDGYLQLEPPAKSVTIPSGPKTFTEIPRGPSSTASDRVSTSTARFTAEYTERPEYA